MAKVAIENAVIKLLYRVEHYKYGDERGENRSKQLWSGGFRESKQGSTNNGALAGGLPVTW